MQDYTLNLGKLQIIDAKFKKSKSSTGNDKFTCEMRVKSNFKEFEKKFMVFNETFIRKRVIKYLPVVHTVFTFVREEHAEGVAPLPETMATAYVNGERGYYQLVAKYYLEPNKKARVMYFDNEYYRGHIASNKLDDIEEDQMVDVKLLPGIDKRLAKDGYEKETWEYCDCFTVRGSACCHPDDGFDKGKGRRIAMLRAMRKAASRVMNLILELDDLVNSEENDMPYTIIRPKNVLLNFELYSEKCNTNDYSDVLEPDCRVTDVFKGFKIERFLER